MKPVHIILFLLLPLSVIARKQGQASIDSLLNELATGSNKEDTNKVKLLNDLSINLSSVDPERGIKYGQQAVDLATKLGWAKGRARGYSVLGTNYHAKADYGRALEYDLQSLKISEETGNKYGIASITNNIGLYYQTQGNYPRALEYYFRSLQINEEMGYKDFKAANLSNIGEVYAAQNNYPTALEYDLKALKLFEELDNRNGVANQLQNIGLVYSVKGDHTKALEYYLKALSINEETGNKKGISISGAGIGDAYMAQRKYAEALGYFRKALDASEQLSDKDGVGMNLGNIGAYYLQIVKDAASARKAYDGSDKKEDLGKAIDYLKRGIDTCKAVGSISNIWKFSELLSEAYQLAGKPKEAYESYKLYKTMKDSVYSATNKMKILNLEAERKIMSQNKQLEINSLEISKKRNERIFYIAGIALLLLVILFIMRNYKTQKNSNLLLSREMNRSDELLLNILPAGVAAELKDNGVSKARHYDHVTVLFTDFVNFTRASEKMTPQELIDELHTCFKAFDEIVTRYNIEKIKTIGDAYLAAAGIPTADPNHAENAVRAALEISEFMRERKLRLKKKTFGIRIGINSGNIVAGIVGVKKFAYDIWGDTVTPPRTWKRKVRQGR